MGLSYWVFVESLVRSIVKEERCCPKVEAPTKSRSSFTMMSDKRA